MAKNINDLKVGMRAAVYHPRHGGDTGRIVGEIRQIDITTGDVRVVKDGRGYCRHYRDVRLLKPKPKSVKVTGALLAKAWNQKVRGGIFADASQSQIFKNFSRALGLEQP